jgi:alanine racemase
MRGRFSLRIRNTLGGLSHGEGRTLEIEEIDMNEGTIVEATIDLDALRSNAALAGRLADGREIIAVVKADAYGHGATAVARTLVEAGCERLAVFTVEEAAELRTGGLAETPILVLAGLRSEEEGDLATRLGLTPVLHDSATLEIAAAAGRRAGRRLAVHVELDTGMSRMGVPESSALKILERIQALDSLELEGLFTHFSRADERDLEPTLDQLRRLSEVLEGARARGIAPRSIHAANSAGLLADGPLVDALPSVTAVRPGLMLYGVRPGPHLGASLRPVMCLQARVIRIQEIEKGQSVGYGAIFRAPRRTRIATLPLGFADGIFCAAAGSAAVWLAGARYPIVGRISMDSIGVDIGDARVELGDIAVVFGNSGRDPEGIGVEEVASWAGTNAYEPLVRVGRRVPRRYIARGLT